MAPVIYGSLPAAGAAEGAALAAGPVGWFGLFITAAIILAMVAAVYITNATLSNPC
jgi:hypothetical protein